MHRLTLEDCPRVRSLMQEHYNKKARHNEMRTDGLFRVAQSSVTNKQQNTLTPRG